MPTRVRRVLQWELAEAEVGVPTPDFYPPRLKRSPHRFNLFSRSRRSQSPFQEWSAPPSPLFRSPARRRWMVVGNVSPSHAISKPASHTDRLGRISSRLKLPP